MESGLHQIDKCEVCGNEDLTSVLDLGLHPLCDDLVAIGESRQCREYPIEILFCTNCNAAHQRFQVPQRDLFPASYHYRSRFTVDVLQGMAGLVESCEQGLGGVGFGCTAGQGSDLPRHRVDGWPSRK